MPVVTVVRSRVGTTLDLPGKKHIRPWHFLELQPEDLTQEMRDSLRSLSAARVVDLAQVIDGSPARQVDLERGVT